jgi:hypothetical protein
MQDHLHVGRSTFKRQLRTLGIFVFFIWLVVCVFGLPGWRMNGPTKEDGRWVSSYFGLNGIHKVYSDSATVPVAPQLLLFPLEKSLWRYWWENI